MENGNELQSPHRGDIWDIDFTASPGLEQKGMRPAVIVQNDWNNASQLYPWTIVVPMSRTERQLLTHVRITPSNKNGLNDDTDVQCDQIMTIKKSCLLRKRGKLSPEEMYRVDQALIVSQALRA